MSESPIRYVDQSSSAYRRELAERRLQEVLGDPETVAEVIRTWDAIERGEPAPRVDWDSLRTRLDLD